MANDTQSTIAIIDGQGNTQNMLVAEDPSDNITYQINLRTNGALITTGNPLPISDASVELALGSTTDAAAPATASASAIALLKTLCQSIAPVATSSLASSLVLKNAAGLLYAFTVTSTSVAGWVLVFNATAAPSAGAVIPIYAWPLQASPGFFSVGFQVPASLSTGIVICFSTTGPLTYTPSATAFITGQVL